MSANKPNRVKADAVAAGAYGSFAELTAVSLASHFLRRGRRHDARRLLLAYLSRHPSTPRIAATLRDAC